MILFANTALGGAKTPPENQYSQEVYFLRQKCKITKGGTNTKIGVESLELADVTGADPAFM